MQTSRRSTIQKHINKLDKDKWRQISTLDIESTKYRKKMVKIEKFDKSEHSAELRKNA